MKKEHLIQFRTDNNLNQTELGLLFGMDQRAISRLETGARGMTKIQRVHLHALDILSRACLLHDFLEKCNKNARKEERKSGKQ